MLNFNSEILMSSKQSSNRLLHCLPKLTLVALVAVVLSACGKNDNEAGSPRQMPPPPVVTAEVQSTSIEYKSEYAGRIRGAREVEVRARVGGILEERLYNEGQIVTAGDPLFRIDPIPYQIALKQAEADLANARAHFNQAEREWNRVSGLYQQDAVSERERDRALSDKELAEARLQLSEAQLESAQLNLDYTQVRAPIAGPTGLETLPEGSLIEPGALLTTIVQQDPIHIRFSLPETDAAIQRAAQSSRQNGSDASKKIGQLILPNGNIYDEPGEIDFTNASIDTRTGTVSARAIFPNPNGQIIPGQFARIRVSLRHYDDIFLLPPSAISEGTEGPRVFVIVEDNAIAARTVALGPVIDGKQVITSGLKNGDKVIINGLMNLHDGMTVNPVVQNGGNH